jgi:phosphoribosylformylglycinamidine synthase subunit PurS
MRYKAILNISLQEGILDPQGKAVEKALHQMDFSQFSNIRFNKQIKLDIEAHDETQARNIIDQACERILVNPSVENYSLSLSQS